MKKIIVLVIFVLTQALAANAQLFAPEELEILKYQDGRTAGPNGELLNYLNNFSNAVVIRALIALGNIGDAKYVLQINEKLQSSNNPDIRIAAAFALGLIQSPESAAALSDVLKTEKDETVLAYILKSLGSVGSEENLKEVCGFNVTTDNLGAATAYSILKFARRNIKNAGSVGKIKSLVTTGSENTKRMCAHAFAYTRDSGLLSEARPEITDLVSSKDWDTRMRAFLAFGYIASANDVKFLMDSYEKENVWQVKNSIINSFEIISRFDKSVCENKDLAFFLVDKGEGEGVYLSTAALRVLGTLFSKTTDKGLKAELLPRLQWFLIKGKAVELATIGEAVNTIGIIYKDAAKDELIQRYKDSEGYYLKPYIVGAFKYMEDAGVYKELRKLITADVQEYVNKNKITDGDMIAGRELAPLYRAFVETLDGLKGKANAEDSGILWLIFCEFTRSKDPSIADVCFNALNADIYTAKRNELKMSMEFDYPDLSYPKDKETMKLFIREFAFLKAENAVKILESNLKINDYEICRESAAALKTITGKDYTFTAKPVSFFDANKLNGLAKKQFAIFHTNQGDIKIKFYPYYSPFSVLNFITLAEKGFYNKTTFHRVVPGFVIQGGDPLNSGWGGPEYTIRSEFIPLSFERGILGMASDGKDTEGSQFFIMHSPYYHLDNSYTIFGEVVSGMEVVDKIYLDDYVESIEITDK